MGQLGKVTTGDLPTFESLNQQSENAARLASRCLDARRGERALDRALVRIEMVQR